MNGKEDAEPLCILHESLHGISTEKKWSILSVIALITMSLIC